MKTNLPFNFPMITHVPFDNCILGILQNYPDTFDWIYSNFINVYINKKNGADYFSPNFFGIFVLLLILILFHLYLSKIILSIIPIF